MLISAEGEKQGRLHRQLQLAKEKREKLEQLRALAHGFGIAVIELPEALPPGVDTPEDLERIRALLLR